jgi:integrase/recombinase XerD
MYIPFVSVTYSHHIFACTNLYPRILTEWNFCLTFLPVFMHLFVYTRHSAKCHRKRDRYWRRCHCPKWIQGVLNGKRIRTSAWTTDWDTAETKAREMEHPFQPAKSPIHQPVVNEIDTAPQRITIKEAVEAFLEDEEGRQLRKGTTGQSKTLLQQQLIPWAFQQNLKYLDELTVSVLTRFRAFWSKDLANSQNTARRKHERLCGFFHFCIRSEWINKNPARLLKPIRVNRVPTGYYTRDEFARIIDATYAYADWKGGHDFEHRGRRLRALLLLMRWGGLAITDAVTLERDKLTADGKLFLYRAKTGTPVYVPLPAEVAQLLREIPNSNPRYFFWSGAGERESAKKPWDKSLRRLFKGANLREADGTPKRCTAHMCRDTFAVELLLSGVPLDQVSLLLAHDSIKVTERHYAPFVKARQEQLEASVRLAWEHMGAIVGLSDPRPTGVFRPN